MLLTFEFFSNPREGSPSLSLCLVLAAKLLGRFIVTSLVAIVELPVSSQFLTRVVAIVSNNALRPALVQIQTFPSGRAGELSILKD